MALSPKANFAAAAGVIAALLAYFMLVDLTQKQTVISMFVVLGAVAAFWFWRKPWK